MDMLRKVPYLLFALEVKDANPATIAGVAGGQADLEAMVCLKDMINRLGSEVLCTEEAFPMINSG